MYSPIEVFAFCSDIGHAIAGLSLALSARGLFLSCTHDNEMRLLFKGLEEEVKNGTECLARKERVEDFVREGG